MDFLNPSFKHGVIPASPENTYKLRLRKKYIGHFINNEMALYSYKTKKGLAQNQLNDLIASSYRESELYTVKSGETIGSIAKKFSMTTTELKSLNGLRKSVKPKQKILVYKKPSRKPDQGGAISTYIPTEPLKDTSKTTARAGEPEPAKTTASAAERTEAQKPVTHTVKSGESLGSIANKYQCTVNQLKQWNDLSSSTLQVGQKLRLSVPSATSKTAAKPETTTSRPPQISQGGKYFFYTIQSGDNLWDIADKYDVTVSQIKNLNNLKNSSRLKPGQKIKIPR